MFKANVCKKKGIKEMKILQISTVNPIHKTNSNMPCKRQSFTSQGGTAEQLSISPYRIEEDFPQSLTPLHDEIMKEIGFSKDLNYYNGSSSCKNLRISSANALKKALSKFHQEGKEVISPVYELIDCVVEMAQKPYQYEHFITDHWKNISDVIKAHIVAFKMPVEGRQEFLDEFLKLFKLRV